METGSRLKVSSDRLVKPGIEPATPGFQGKRFVHYTTAAPKEAAMANSLDTDQTAPIGAVCSGSMLFASILNSSIMLGNYLQQTTSADDIFRCIFLGALRVN